MSIKQPCSCARGKKIVPLKAEKNQRDINGIINCNCAKCNKYYYTRLLTEKQVFLKSHLLFCNILTFRSHLPLRMVERRERHAIVQSD